MLHKPALPLALVALLAFGGAALAQGTGQQATGQSAQAKAASPHKVVVELFTSQGCASCPPADVLLGELAKDPQVIALSLSVDYWDYIGWKDTLALHGHSLRQKAYAEMRPDRKVYTPQVVVDGQFAAKGSDRAAVHRAVLAARGAAQPKVPLDVERAGDAIEVRIGAAEEPVAAIVWACPVSSSQQVAIGRGENGGRNATYSNVVRGWVRLGSWDGRSLALNVPVAELRRDGVDAVAILVQAGPIDAPGRILGAAMVPLN
ncbi:DUF1223 domain-containing protein [Xanthobacter tagetidis]|jgi:hypothetical protein|uniref:DUF1223 domain-containing protein n=1 Tax=Xanthobacter tagetidis TaxID=60216 RepID=A0A3L7AH47_9HYPH|nr:DUF1223 domain-containing protein [Xanthobacter tagetidis]MBB6306597.1 hypothetical protein [Xanthobacter tagetidis]RLP79080.1 DUF1223 domain-containing protein [Xanthobacter tagetidis]